MKTPTSAVHGLFVYKSEVLPLKTPTSAVHRLFAYHVMKKEDVLLDTSDMRSSQCRPIILQFRIHVTHETRHFRSHAVLHGESGVRQIVVDESLKEREVQLVVTAQFVHSGGGPQLLVVADQDQVLALLVQGRHHVGFQHLRTQSEHLQTQS